MTRAIFSLVKAAMPLAGRSAARVLEFSSLLTIEDAQGGIEVKGQITG